MFFHWLSLSNGLILDLDDSYNTVFEADNADKLRYGLKQCWTEALRPLMTVSHYSNGCEKIIQKEFLLQDPDGYLLRFTDWWIK